MAPKSLHARSDDGRTFSIIFAVVAGAVVLGCLVWGFIIPRLRKISITKANVDLEKGHMARPGSVTKLFPSHPALLRGFGRKTAHEVARYDPRTESPFPSHNNGQASPTPSMPRSCSPLGSNGLFTPTKMRPPTRGNPLQAQNSKHHKDQGNTRAGDIEMMNLCHAQDYILPVPEPLVLRPRPAGRPPPLARQLERFPMPFGTRKRHPSLMHPSKLFGELDIRNSESTSGTTSTPCPEPHHTKKVKGDGPQNAEMTLPVYGLDNDKSAEVAKRDNGHNGKHESIKKTSDIVVLVKSEGFMGSSGTKSPISVGSLERAGTVTRPKTPVAERRMFFDRTLNEQKSIVTSSRDRYTPSTNPFTTPRPSRRHRLHHWFLSKPW
jgi:hypothetical protein